MKKTTRKQLRTIRRQRLAMALVGAMAMPMLPAMAQSLPTSGDVVNGSATIGQTGSQMTVTQTTKGAIIDWGSFNIGAGYGVTFDQQFGSSSVTLNRVIGFGYGGSPSSINGTLTSNGNVFIINPAGITFGNNAQVNVGGLVASTLDMSNADFLSGLTSGQYRFVGNGSDAGTVFNSGQLTAADGGTIGLIGSYISNSGTITANLGSVVFGATNDVTLDFFGDGLTQVTVSGNGLARSNCSLNCTGGITSNGNVFAQGGHIEMRTNTMDGATAGNALFVDPANGGRIWISGNVVARTSGTRRGSIIIDAGQGNIDLGGVDGRTGNVSVTAINAGENAGTIELRGNQLFTHLCYGTGPTDLCVNNNRLGLVNASAFGTGGNAGEIHIDVNRFYHGGLLQAVANDGSGGLIDITAGNAEIYNWVFAYGNNGSGGTINIDADDLLLFRGQQAWLGGPGTAYWSASLLAYGTTTGGSVNIDAGNMVVIDLGNVTPESPDLVPVINVTGQLGGNGGNITINAGSASIDDTLFADASGEGAGGSIDITADDLWLGGGLVANGGTGGGIVSTTTTGSLFAAGSAYVHAGTWRIHAPSASIVSAIDAGPGSGAVITDAALGAALDDGTIVQLMADASLSSGASGSIYIGDGVAIVHDSDEDAALELMATGGIYGSTFSIESSGAGALDMDFRANVDGDDPDNGFVSFHDVVLASNGGSINLEGNGSGVYLEFGDVSSAGGDIRITGSGESVGVYLLLTSVSSGDGDIAIDGSASLVQDLAYPFGVALAGSSLTSTGGDISVIGDAAGGTGVQFWSVYDSDSGTNVYSSITTDSGAITLDSTGLRGLGLNGIDLATDSGDITLAGTALDEYATAAVFIGSGGITTNGGDITITGTGGATGVWLYQGDVISNGGDITIAGEGFHYGVQVWENLVSSGAGSIDIDGTATGSDSTGLNVRDAAFVATSGDITLSGSAAQGLGAFFGGISYGPGSSVTTGSGAISVISTGLSGLNVGDVPFTTDTGSITLQGTALGDDFGVYVGAGGLSSNGGDITIIGSSTTYTGVWVNGGDIASNGGDITITGTSTDLAGVQISGSDIDSAGGDIVIRGEGPTSTGLIVASANISSGAGNIDLSGVGGGFGAGVSIGQGSVVSTTSGDLSIDGVSNSYHGVTIRASDVYTASGDIGIAGQGGSGAGFWIDADSSIDGGDGLVTVRAGNDGTSDSVRIDGSIASNTGVNLRPLDGNGTILLGSGTGFALSAAELASIDSPELVIGSAQHAGAILVQDAITRDGNLTLQNQGGSGGIDLQAGIDLGDYTLALATGGDITQSASAAIIAHSLLAIATGDVLLGTAQNDVAATTLAGSSGGDFEFLDATALSIGSVSARGFDAANGQLSGVSRNGINAGGDALVRNLAGNLTLQSGITAHAIDLVTAGALQNAAGATLTAANGWRVWASSWVGETRGGLAGNGALPNLYGCNFNGACAATAPAAGSNYFIYQQQPTAFVVIGSASREYGLANPAFTYSITGGILGDGQGSIASGTPISAATVGSNVGSYAITGSFISPAGYALQFSPGTLSITPATLVFTADEMLRYFGFGNPDFTGTFSGFRNGDTVQSAFNGEVNIYTTAGSGSLGYFPIFASGNSLNYVIQQAPGNEVALQIVPAPQSASALTEFISDPNHSYVYESNIARDWMCPLGAPTEDELLQAAGNDDLGRDWLKVRRRLQLNNCIDSRDAPGCRF